MSAPSRTVPAIAAWIWPVDFGDAVRRNEIGLRHGNDALTDAEEIEDCQMLQRLRLDAVIGSDRQQSKVDPARARQHRVYEALVAWHVDEAENLAIGSRQIRKAEIDRDPPRLLFFQAIAIDAGQGFDQCRLAVIDVASGPDDHSVLSAEFAWAQVKPGSWD